MALTTNLGYPRIGPNRELKWVVEKYWAGQIGRAELLAQAAEVRRAAWRAQAERGIDLIPSNDFTLYDHVLDHAVMFGAVPHRFGWQGGPPDLDVYFGMARGTADAPACEMTKWFNTNYHYIVPEFEGHFTLTENRPLQAFETARRELGLETKPVILGPFTFLKLGENRSGRPLESLLADLLPLYMQVLRELEAAGVRWVQVDEPMLVTDLGADDLALVEQAYSELTRAKGALQVMIQTYFDDIAPHYERIVTLPVEGIGLDFVAGPRNLVALEQHGFPAGKVLGIGIVNGRNVWRTDLMAALDLLERIGQVADLNQAHIGPSCSLLHLPISLQLEQHLNPTIKGWMAYANERLEEVALLAQAINEGRASIAEALAENQRFIASRRASPMTTNPAVRERLNRLTEADFHRTLPYEQRRRLHAQRLNLPLFPTTTIGSFPQTPEVRRARARYMRGEMDAQEYQRFLREQFRHAIAIQEEIGLDVLVHGEFERSDMVDYFAQQMEGIAFIEGWVQSYGTRCVRPPLIYGDVSRPHPMTVEVSRYVQSLTTKPVKGMLTGPVTILMWSFARDDIPREQIAYQIALAIRDETVDLERAGIGVIQIDEPAFREGLPLKRADWEDYLRWAVRAFRLASSGVKDETQLHTHMCYAEFGDILPALREMDADVVSIENSRSGSELLEVFRHFRYDHEIGPGVYDVHSARIPSVEEMRDLVLRSAEVIDPHLVWVNPDCGLKTRRWEEVIPALKNMVQATREARARLAAQAAEGRREA